MFFDNTQYNNNSTRREDYFQERESVLFNSSPTISLFVQTDDPAKKMLVVCHKDDSISKPNLLYNELEKLSTSIANIYYKTFCDANNEDVEEDDCYYEKIATDKVSVTSLYLNGFILPLAHVLSYKLNNE